MNVICTLLLSSFLADVDPPANSPPTPQQLDSAVVAAAKSEALAAQRDLSTFQTKAAEDNLWSVVKAVLLTGGGLSVFGGWLANQMKERHKNALEAARVDAELKAADRKSATDNEIALSKAGLDTDNFVIKSLQEEVVSQRQEMVRLRDRLEREEKRTSQMREEIFHLTTHLDEWPWASVSINLEDEIVHVTPTFERAVLVPMGKKRGEIMHEDFVSIWPEPVRKRVQDLRDKAKDSPEHYAWAPDFVFNPGTGPFVVGITVHRHNDRPCGFSMVAFPEINRLSLTDSVPRDSKG